MSPKQTFLSLEHTSIGVLQDDSKSRPKNGGFVAIGLSPDHIESVDIDPPGFAKERIAWLNCQPEMERVDPQPWRQLIAVLEARGDRIGARKAFLQMRRNQALYSEWPFNVFHSIRKNRESLGWLISAIALWPILYSLQFLSRVSRIHFSYLQIQPLWILAPLAMVITLGAVAYRTADQLMVPADDRAFECWTKEHKLPGNIPRFSPIGYSIETTLPVLKLGQADKWIPGTSASTGASRLSYPFITAVRWCQICAGWALVGVVTAAIASQFKT